MVRWIKIARINVMSIQRLEYHCAIVENGLFIKAMQRNDVKKELWKIGGVLNVG